MNNLRFWPIALMAIFVAALIFVPACGDDDDDDDDDDKPAAWNIEVVDQEGDVGMYNALVLDSSGTAHIAYFDADNSALKYATNGSGSWVVQTLTTNDLVEGYTSIGVETAGTVHVAFCGNGLWYANNSGGEWKSPSILAATGCQNDMDVSGDGGVFIGYVSTDGLSYFGRSTDADAWETDLIQTGTVSDPAIVAAPGDRVHLTYAKAGALEYAHNEAGGFQTWVVDDSGDAGRYSSIAYVNGTMHVSYNDAANGALKYASNSGGDWTTLTVDENAQGGTHTSIALDEGGTVHISYFGDTAVKYASNFAAVWETGAVDAKVGSGGAASSLAVDADGYIHISFYDANDGLLKFATSTKPIEYLDF